MDAFNPLTNWYDPDVMEIDLGITMLMAENHRTGFVWKTLMKNKKAQGGSSWRDSGRSTKCIRIIIRQKISALLRARWLQSWKSRS